MEFTEKLIKKIYTFIENSHFLLLFTFLSICILWVIGSIPRWDLLQQIAMADSYILNGYFYPSLSNASDALGVSPYFPGNAFIAALLSKAGIGDYIVEVMLFIGFIVFVLFLKMHLVLVKELFDIKVPYKTFIPIVVLFTMGLTPFYLRYALEFKPDSIAILIGLYSLVFVKFLKNDTKYITLIFGALICSIGIIFKQQYISFILGLVLFCIIFFTARRIIFASFLTLFSSILIAIFAKNENLWFWNVSLLSNDGMENLSAIYDFIIVQNLPTIFFVLGFLGALSLSNINTIKRIYSDVNISKFKELIKTPLIWVLIPSIFTAIISSTKHGGNAGNVQLGIFLLMPFFIYFLLKVKTSILMLIAWSSIIIQIPMVYHYSKIISATHQLYEFAETIDASEFETVLTGSNLYFVSRKFRHESKIVDFWVEGILNDIHPSRAIGIAIEKNNPDIIFAEYFPGYEKNYEFLEADRSFKIIFSNSVGLVIVRE